MNPNMSQGPDEFSILFYQKFWDLIKYDIVQIFSDFYNYSLDIAKLNRALICLISKVIDTSTIKDFRPTSILNCSFNFFTKVLTSRLHPYFRPFDRFESTYFFKGQNNMDNVIAAPEILHLLKLTKNLVFSLN
jgi:hypothetical protein